MYRDTVTATCVYIFNVLTENKIKQFVVARSTST